MAQSKTLKAHVLKLLSELHTAVEQLAHDAEAGEAIRAMFSSNGVSHATPSKKPKIRVANGSAAVPNTKKRRAKKQKATKAKHGRPSTKAASGDQIVQLITTSKDGIGAREIGAALGLKTPAVSYQLKKLLTEKKVLKKGKTANTVYLPQAA